jgi:3-oxoacyl-[acyl-carrier protein] reductase
LRRALVTGAASGLAAGIAPALAHDGFDFVGITYRTTEPQSTLDAIRATGSNASAYRIDFSAPEREVQDQLALAIREGGPYDTLVHAVGPIVVKRFARLTLDDYREMFDGNVRSAVLAAAAVLPSMRAAGFGRIVYFGMNGSEETRAYRGFTLHQAAKSAVVAFAKCLALEEAEHGITVNVVEPGDIRKKTLSRELAHKTPGGTPRGRTGSYEDVADVVRFLVAPERDFVTGAVLAVTGGLTEAAERNASPS